MSAVHLTRTEHGATLTIDNQTRGNALTPVMMQEMASQVAVLAAEIEESGGPFGALVIRGAGDRAFCAGYDLDSLHAETRERPDLVIPELLELLECLTGFPGTTIAALQGHAIGGGALLASLCDLRYARSGVRLRIPTTRIGILYPLPGLRRLVALLGLGRAAELLLLAEDLRTERGLAWGLYQEVLTDSRALFERVEAVTAALASRSPLASRGALAVLRRLGVGGDGVEELHAEWLARCVASEDLDEGLRAARERREPAFRGR